jgi:N-acetylglucosaminyl-diphospho-decaprenol L-rhamnosyltransferase
VTRCRVSVISVTYRSASSVEAWLDTLGRAWAACSAAGDHLNVVVVDNASDDGTTDIVRAHALGTDIIELSSNRGFAAGCNAGLGRVSDDDIVVLLNPDVFVAKDFFRRLVELSWPDDLAARGPLILEPDGTVEQSARSFPRLATGLAGRTSLLARIAPNSELVRRELRADPSAGSTTVDWVSGACLIAPAEAFRRVGGLDEGYFLYWEDADWCRRASHIGLRVEYEPSLVATHRQGTSSERRPVSATVSFHWSAARYYRRHVARSPVAGAAATALLMARCLSRMVPMIVSGHRRPPGRRQSRDSAADSASDRQGTAKRSGKRRAVGAEDEVDE